MRSTDGHVIYSQITDAWDRIAEAVRPFASTLSEEKVRELQEWASQTFLERSGIGQVQEKDLADFFVSRAVFLEHLALDRVYGALAGEAYAKHDMGTFHLITAELRGTRKEQK